jgi:basic membrane protein A
MRLFPRRLGLAIVSTLLACAAQAQTSPFLPAVIYDAGGKFDKSFNEAAFEGAERFKKEFGTPYLEAEVGSSSQSEQIFRSLIRRKATVIFATGFQHLATIARLAPEFSDVKFVMVNAKPDEPRANIQSVLFPEEEGSFLAGMAAASVSKTGKVGFVGGMDLPLIRRFGCGYAQGAAHVNPNIQLLANMAGTTPAAFRDPTRGRELALSQFDRGADVVFAAAGNTGTGVLQAAKDKGQLAIGVDSNQNYMHPGTVLTSMVKHLDVAVYEAFKMVKNNNWKAGDIYYGLGNNGLSLAIDQNNRSLISPALEAKIKKAREEIVSGKLKVHDYVKNNACPVAFM